MIPDAVVNDSQIQGKIVVRQGEIGQVNQEAMKHLAQFLPNKDPASGINGGVPEALAAAIQNKYYSHGNPDGAELAIEGLTNIVNERREYAAKKSGGTFEAISRDSIEDAIHQGYADASRRRNTPAAEMYI